MAPQTTVCERSPSKLATCISPLRMRENRGLKKEKRGIVQYCNFYLSNPLLLVYDRGSFIHAVKNVIRKIKYTKNTYFTLIHINVIIFEKKYICHWSNFQTSCK